jgi:hypothetical protein
VQHTRGRRDAAEGNVDGDGEREGEREADHRQRPAGGGAEGALKGGGRERADAQERGAHCGGAHRGRGALGGASIGRGRAETARETILAR